MSNDFFNATSVPASNASLSSAIIKAEFASVAAGFDKMPALTGNGSKVIMVNSGGTVLEASATLTSVTLAGTLTISAATRTISADFVETRAKGAAASGVSYLNDHQSTFSGHADGTSSTRAYRFLATGSGSNPMAAVVCAEIFGVWQGSATLTQAYNSYSEFTHEGTGTITTGRLTRSSANVYNTGGFTTCNLFNAYTTTFTSTGAIGTINGFLADNLGHASLVTVVNAFKALDQTASLTRVTAFAGEVSSGTNKYNLYMSGTAPNYLAGKLLVGHTASLDSLSGDEKLVQVHGGQGFFKWSNDNTCSSIAFRKSRGVTPNSHVAVQSGDNLLLLSGGGSDGTAWPSVVSGQIIIMADGTIAAGRVPGRISFLTATNAAVPVITEALRIDSGQNVIIGTAAIATTATDGFLRIPSCAGAPTGVPSSYAGRSPIVHDTTNNRLYLYDTVSAAWQYAALT